jgi:hypothetical protein
MRHLIHDGGFEAAVVLTVLTLYRAQGLIAGEGASGGPGTQPRYWAYLVAEDDPGKARALIGRHLRPNEIAYALAAFPDALQRIPGPEPGGVMRL